MGKKLKLIFIVFFFIFLFGCIQQPLINKKTDVLIVIAPESFNELAFEQSINLLKEYNMSFLISSTVNLAKSDFSLSVKPDLILTDVNVDNFNAILLIPGKGMLSFENDSLLKNILIKANKKQKIIAGIGESVIVIASAGLLKEKNATTLINLNQKLVDYGVIPSLEKLVVIGNIITAQNHKFTENLIRELIIKLS